MIESISIDNNIDEVMEIDEAVDQENNDISEETTDFIDDFSIDDLFFDADNKDDEECRSPEARLWYNSNTYNFDRCNWLLIYQNLLKLGPLNKSVIWNDEKSLSLAQFAVSKLAIELLSIKKWKAGEKALSREYRSCFLELVDRTIELKPLVDKYRSSKAYFFYSYYISGHHEETDFQNAFDLLKDLAQNPSARFKDAQRFIMLRQVRWSKPRYKDEARFDELCIEYDTLIEVYETLNQREQGRCQRNYISCKYNFSKLHIERLWNETLTPYFKHISTIKIENDQEQKKWENNESEENIERKAIIKKCRTYLHDVSENIPISDTIESVQNKNNVRFIEVDYRSAQLLTVQGMLCVIVGCPIEKIYYFAQASDLLNQTFKKVDSLIEQGARFNYPWYAKSPYALAEFAVGNYNVACSLLLSVPKEVKPYGFYIQARHLLSRMLPYFPSEMLFNGNSIERHAVIKYALSDEMKKSLESMGYSAKISNDNRAINVFESKEPIGYSDFYTLLSDVYSKCIRSLKYDKRQEMIRTLRLIVSKYTHYKPEFDDVLVTAYDRILAAYYLNVSKMMMPARNRNTYRQIKINSTCTAIFEKEMIASLEAVMHKV